MFDNFGFLVILYFLLGTITPVSLGFIIGYLYAKSKYNKK